MYILGSKLDHQLANHFIDSNDALYSVLLLAEHNETLLTCGIKEMLSHHIKAMRGILNKLSTEINTSLYSMAGYCEHSSEPSASLKDKEFQLVKCISLQKHHMGHINSSRVKCMV